MKKKIAFASFLLWSILEAAPARMLAQCTTNFNTVYCGNCPGNVNNCWDSHEWSYQVFGDPIETWCNYGPGGWCDAYLYCTTTSSITTSRDCNGNEQATQS